MIEWSETHLSLRDSVRRFVDAEIKPKLRELEPSAVGLLTSLQGGRTLVTLAPEMTTPEIIAALVKAGVVVSAGHTNATNAEISIALRQDRKSVV